MVGMQGPVCTDLHHSFVQRWNSAVVVEAPEVVCYPTPEQCSDLQFPTELFLAEGAEESLCRAQLQRSVCAANTWVSASAVDGSDFDIREGEASILEQYEKAIDHAKEVIYLENQHIAHVGHLLEPESDSLLTVAFRPLYCESWKRHCSVGSELFTSRLATCFHTGLVPGWQPLVVD